MFAAICALSFIACNLGDTGGDGSGSTPSAPVCGYFDESTNIYYSYTDSNENGQYDVDTDRLQYYIQYDFDSQGRVEFSMKFAADDTLIESSLYEYSGDLLVKTALFDQNNTLAEILVYSYSGTDLTQISSFDGSSVLQGGDLYVYDTGKLVLSLKVDSSSSVVSGYEYGFDASDRVVRRNQFADLSGDAAVPGHDSLDADKAGGSPEPALPMEFTNPNLSDTAPSYKPDSITMPATPAVTADFGISDTTAALRGINRVWDSYWYFEDLTGDAHYSAATFNAQVVPVEGGDYGLSGDLSAVVNLPVRFYLDATGVSYEGYEMSGPVQVDLEYAPNELVVTSKTITYAGNVLLDLGFGYTGGMISSMEFTGSILAGNQLELAMSYTSNGLPHALDLNTGGVRLQRWEYSYTVTDPSDFLSNVNTLTWYDGNFDETGADPDAGLVGHFDFVYDSAASSLTLTSYEAGSTDPQGSFVAIYDVDGLQASFGSYDAAGNELFLYSYGYEDALALAEEGYETASANVETFYSEMESLDFYGADPGDLPGVPKELLDFDYTDFSSMAVFFMEEMEGFLP